MFFVTRFAGLFLLFIVGCMNLGARIFDPEPYEHHERAKRNEKALPSLKLITASGELIVIQQLGVANVGNVAAEISASDFTLVRRNAAYAAYEPPQTFSDSFIAALRAALRAIIRRGLYKFTRNPLDDVVIVTT